MENTKTELGLLELLIIDALIMFVFVFLLFIAIISPAKNLFAMNLSLVFGAATLPFAAKLGRWLAFLRHHENQKLAEMLNISNNPSGWMLFDLGINGHSWMFRIMSVVTAGFSLYHLIIYVVS